MFATILFAVAFVVVAACVGISLLRGFSKSVLRGASVLLAAIFALVTGLVMKSKLSELVLNLVLEGGEALDLNAMGEISPTLVEVITQLAGALVAPLAYLLFFFLYWFILGIACLVVSIVLKGLMKKLNDLVPLSRLWAAAVGLVEGLILAGVLLMPIAGYVSLLHPVMDGMVEQGLIEKNEENEEVLAVIAEVDEAPVLAVHRALGGELVADALMSVKVDGNSVNLREETSAILGLLMTVSELGETEMKDYGPHEVELLRSLGDSFGESDLVAPIVGDILYGATDAWLEGEDFMGAEAPRLGEDDATFGPFMNTLLQILHDDAKETDLLQKDIATFADVMAILIEKDVMANLDNSDVLMEKLSGDGVVKSLIQTLKQNESMEPLVDEVMAMGMRAIGQVLVVPENAEEQYGEFMDEVAASLNKVANIPADQRVEVLTNELNKAFGNAEVAIDSEILEYYTEDILSELVDNKDGEVTEEDVREYFRAHSN